MAFLENIFPLIVIYFIWRIFTKAQKSIAKDENVGPKGEVADNDSAQVSISIRDVLRQIMTGGELEIPRVQQPLPVEIQSSLHKPVPSSDDQSFSRADADKVDPVQYRYGQGGDLKEEKSSDMISELPSSVERRPGMIYSRGELRQAVIWSEILAKPLALRNNEQDGF